MTDTEQLEIVADETNAVFLSLESPDGGWKTLIKRDGCVDIHKRYDDGQESCLHVCDLAGFVALMELIREAAKAKWADWPREW